jgi:hypothetical protein
MRRGCRAGNVPSDNRPQHVHDHRAPTGSGAVATLRRAAPGAACRLQRQVRRLYSPTAASTLSKRAELIRKAYLSRERVQNGADCWDETGSLCFDDNANNSAYTTAEARCSEPSAAFIHQQQISVGFDGESDGSGLTRVNLQGKRLNQITVLDLAYVYHGDFRIWSAPGAIGRTSATSAYTAAGTRISP